MKYEETCGLRKVCLGLTAMVDDCADSPDMDVDFVACGIADDVVFVDDMVVEGEEEGATAMQTYNRSRSEQKDRSNPEWLVEIHVTQTPLLAPAPSSFGGMASNWTFDVYFAVLISELSVHWEGRVTVDLFNWGIIF